MNKCKPRNAFTRDLPFILMTAHFFSTVKLKKGKNKNCGGKVIPLTKSTPDYCYKVKHDCYYY